MKRASLSFIGRNLLGLLALLLAHNIVDAYFLGELPGALTHGSYGFLVLMYAWLVFHNRVLFERLLMRGNRVAYVGWLLLFLGLGSLNMHLIISHLFGIPRTLPHILRYYSDTVTGLSVYVTYRYLTTKRSGKLSHSAIPVVEAPAPESAPFTCVVNGALVAITPARITYIEGLENYLKIVTPDRTHIARMTLKEAESRLPKGQFVRISKSHIVNVARTERIGSEAVLVGNRTLRIGRVFKRYAQQMMNVER